ncbi:MAG: hypothetical protein WAR79_14110 [Melioribacteraceae bacterium]
MNFFKRIEGNNIYGEPYISKLLTAFLEILDKNILLNFINNLFKTKSIEPIKSIKEFEVEEQKQIYFNYISFILPEASGKPDIGIKLTDNEGTQHYIIIEIKRDDYKFNQKDNTEKLSLYYNTIKNISNAYLIGISDHEYENSCLDKFIHITWKNVFDFFSRTDDDFSNKISKELKDYKNKSGKVMEKFESGYSDLISSSIIYKEHENDYNNFRKQMHHFYKDIISLIKDAVNAVKILDNVYSQSNEDFVIKENLQLIFLNEFQYYLQFRICKHNCDQANLLSIISIPESNLSDEIDYLLTGNGFEKGYKGGGNQEYNFIHCSGNDFKWDDIDWVNNIRSQIVNQAVELFITIKGVYEKK